MPGNTYFPARRPVGRGPISHTRKRLRSTGLLAFRVRFRSSCVANGAVQPRKTHSPSVSFVPATPDERRRTVLASCGAAAHRALSGTPAAAMLPIQFHHLGKLLPCRPNFCDARPHADAGHSRWAAGISTDHRRVKCRASDIAGESPRAIYQSTDCMPRQDGSRLRECRRRCARPLRAAPSPPAPRRPSRVVVSARARHRARLRNRRGNCRA